MPVSEQASPPPSTRRGHWAPRVLVTVAVALIVAWACGAAMRADARLATPPGFFRGLLHGGMMPVAWPTLLAGRDQDIYAARNEGRTYKLGYSMGVNLSGLIFFSWLFLTAGGLKSMLQRKSPQ